MRRASVVVFLGLVFPFVVGCELDTGPNPDVVAAGEFVRKMYSNVWSNVIPQAYPEYANIPTIPRDHLAKDAADRSAACGVRVLFEWRDQNRFTTDDWIVWVNTEHKAVGFSPNPKKDDWRPWV